MILGLGRCKCTGLGEKAIDATALRIEKEYDG